MRPGWRPKLVALDLDGTVVPYGRAGTRPSLAVAAAVGRVIDAGVPVVVATGRAVPDAVDTAVALGIRGVELVCTNGAVVYDAGTASVIHSVTVDVAPAAKALAARIPEAVFAAERAPGGFVVTDGFHREFTVGRERVVDLETLVAEPTVRLVCVAPGWDVTRMGAVAAEVLDPAEYSWDLGFSAWLDVQAPGVSKATGTAMVCADLGIDPSDVLAIGDGTNDIELFKWVGWAVAMGQAPEVVQSFADEVTDPVELDGCATVLSRWFP
ncbi:HAD family hydrolase [Cryptosporangium phraense]|uniref:HAD family hydrolase n=1 Tax=Cryptosporangium phraense TaxID=2593070 RepID=UPI00147846BE|nr:HAD family hydrolase [Cryptosporangium phraense]